jgi:Carboxypeptidase regulatory-like domain
MRDRREQLAALARGSLSDEDCPNTMDLAAYALGDRSGTEQLKLAAHIRSCPLCQQLIAMCTPAEALPQPLHIAQLLTAPLGLGLRSSGLGTVRHYRVADMMIELTIPAAHGDQWRLTGHLSRAGQPLSEVLVTATDGVTTYDDTSDAVGFFSFRALPPGNYTLTAITESMAAQILNLVLNDDEDSDDT